MDPVETKIMRSLAAKAIGAGYQIAVTDGEETVLEPSNDVESVINACGITDESIFVIYGHGFRMGFIHFVHGNGEDVLHNHTDNTFFTWLTQDGYIQ